MIKIGTSGFSFKDWKGTVYPEDIANDRMLSYYEQELGFDTVEINFTYYVLPSEKSFSAMKKKVSKDFLFSVKAFRGTTHDPFDYRLAKKPSLEQAKENSEKFIHSLSPLISSNQLCSVLLQFPVFFSPEAKNYDYILKCREWMKNAKIIVEFRNNKWATEETMKFLRENDIAYCAVDEPKLERLMPYIPKTTSDIGYLRFHGRNKNWFNAPAEQRYDYLYSDDELKEFIPDIEKMNSKCKFLYLFFNNCHLGSAIKNARKIKDFLKSLLDKKKD